MQSKFKYLLPDNPRINNYRSTLIQFGEEKGFSAMAKLVSCPVAIITEVRKKNNKYFEFTILFYQINMPNILEILMVNF